MQERENILRIFKETKAAVSRGDSAKIKNLSNETNNTAALTNDPDNIAAAVIVYSLSKIIERVNYSSLPGWKKFYDTYLLSIDKIISSVEKKDDESYRKNIQIIRDAIEKLSGPLKQNIQDVFRKASINKASKLYEHGISMETTAKLLGISIFELADYAGTKETMNPTETKTISARERIKTAMGMFE